MHFRNILLYKDIGEWMDVYLLSNVLKRREEDGGPEKEWLESMYSKELF
jgi:hypothetical protein